MQEQEWIQEAAQIHERGAEFEFETSASFGQAHEWFDQAGLSLIVLRLPEDEPLQTFFFMKLKKDVPKTMPLLLLSATITQPLLQLTHHFSKLRMLKLPVNPAFLYRAVLDITTEWEPGKQQVHPRYATEYEVEVRLPGDGARAPAMMKNMSLGGAFFELPDAGGLDLKPTDVVEISIRIPGADEYVFEARVVWLKPVAEGVTGYGCTFTDMDETLQSLLRSQ